MDSEEYLLDETPKYHGALLETSERPPLLLTGVGMPERLDVGSARRVQAISPVR
jgi:hypothetical protein